MPGFAGCEEEHCLAHSERRPCRRLGTSFRGGRHRSIESPGAGQARGKEGSGSKGDTELAQQSSPYPVLDQPHRVEMLCELAGLSRQTVQEWRDRSFLHLDRGQDRCGVVVLNLIYLCI